MVCQVFPFTNGLGWSMRFGGQESPGSNTDICKIWMQYRHSPVPWIRKNCIFFTAFHSFYTPVLLADLNLSYLIFLQVWIFWETLQMLSHYCQKREVLHNLQCQPTVHLAAYHYNFLDFLFLHNQHISYLKKGFYMNTLTIALLMCLNESQWGLNDDIRNLFSTTF